VLEHNQALATVHEFRERLKAIWSGVDDQQREA
jgi:hypothetical protein